MTVRATSMAVPALVLMLAARAETQTIDLKHNNGRSWNS